jgi:hypothetical protein
MENGLKGKANVITGLALGHGLSRCEGSDAQAGGIDDAFGENSLCSCIEVGFKGSEIGVKRKGNAKRSEQDTGCL